MSEDVSENRLLTAVEDFRAARFHASMERIRATLTGKSADLLSYDDVRQKIHATETAHRELKEVPLSAIVGSVGRYADFTRQFLPRNEDGEARWVRVRAHADSMEGLPPIELFQIGDVYFVRDGNHRVSVAREMGNSHIEAYVTQVETSVPLTPDIMPDDLIIKERYARFLAVTGLDKGRPDVDFSMSAAGNYRVLEQQIERHQRWLSADNAPITLEAAAVSWYDDVYEPVVELIRQRGLLRDFPHRTETDLYVWIDKHRGELVDHLKWTVDMETAVSDFAAIHTPRSQQILGKLKSALIPKALHAGPPPGHWRRSLGKQRRTHLLSHILVAIDGQDTGWNALEHTFLIARKEGGTVWGVHVVDDATKMESKAAHAVQAEFDRRCAEAGIVGELTVTTGPPTDTLCYRARWADLLVVSLSHPPGPQAKNRLYSQFGQLLRRSPRPVLAVPLTHTALDRVLLAYDGSRKGEEALFAAAYLAGQWSSVQLTVVVALGRGVMAETETRARDYLESQHIEADYVVGKGLPAPLIMETAEARGCGLIVMGGYGKTAVGEIALGSIVDEILRTRRWPILICR